MSPEEINIAIAEACGWKWSTGETFHFINEDEVREPWTPVCRVLCRELSGGAHWCSLEELLSVPVCANPLANIPNYHGDLNALMEAWQTLSDGQRFTFRGIEARLAHERGLWAEEALVKHGAEIFLRTVGKWKEAA